MSNRYKISTPATNSRTNYPHAIHHPTLDDTYDSDELRLT